MKPFIIASHCGLLNSKATRNVIQMRLVARPIRKQKIRKQEGNGKLKDNRKRNKKAAATSLPPYTAPMTVRRCGRCAASGITRWIGRGMGGHLSAHTTPSAPRSSAGSARAAGFRRCSGPCWIGWSTDCGKAAWRTRRIRISIKAGGSLCTSDQQGPTESSAPTQVLALTPSVGADDSVRLLRFSVRFPYSAQCQLQLRIWKP